MSPATSSFPADVLLTELEALPDWLALTPIGKQKNAYLSKWDECPQTKDQIRAEIAAGRCHAVGMICGAVSGLLVLDHDGASAEPLLRELLDGVQLPPTWGWTSTRQGRRAAAFRVPEKYWPALKGKWDRRTGVKSPDDGKIEGLELRWTGHQSVLIGHHPLTGGYRWLENRSPADLPEPAVAPLPLIEALLEPPQTQAPVLVELPTPSPLSLRLPLLEFVSLETRQFVESGGTPGSWNDDQLKHAQDLIGTDRWIQQHGHIPEPSARDAYAYHITAAKRKDSSFDEHKAWRRFEGGLKRDLHPSTPPEKLQERLAYNTNKGKRPETTGIVPKGTGNKFNKAKDQKLPATFLDLIRSLSDGWAERKCGPPSPSKLSPGEMAGMLPADRLRFNEMSLLPEVHTSKGWYPIRDADIDSAYVLLSQKGWIISTEPITKAICHVARLQSFHPVRHYLLSLEQNDSITPFDLDQVAPRFFRANDRLHIAMVRKWLIGAVARALNPGCQMDYALVLQSDEQGLCKSTTFKALASPEWFNSTVPDADKDFLLAVHSCWIFELAEIEHITGGRAEGRLKNLITTSIDSVRPPYGRTTQRMPRGSVFAGTVNAREFLRDSTGNRRYWVVPIEGKQELDREGIRQSRDAIWKAAVMAWRSGELPMLDRRLAAESEAQNHQYVTEDPWLAMLRAWIDGNPLGAHLDPKNAIAPVDPSQPFSTAEALHAAGLRRLDQCGRSEETRIAPLLRQLGFEKGPQQRRNGERVRLWSKTSSSVPSQPSQPASTHAQGGCDTHNPLQRIDSQNLSQPSQPTSSKAEIERTLGQPEDDAAGTEEKKVVTIVTVSHDSAKPAAMNGGGLSQPPVTNSDPAVVTRVDVVTPLLAHGITPDRIPCLVNGEPGWSRKAGPMPRLTVCVSHADGRQLAAGADQVTDLSPSC
ncbi:bifunctional DNA primase/polymerase [Synechococcus sp. L2F]|uniref:VapE domain-containing protein n=1 Tax=Synechococcus sp. L2F TaxID=2823739 RepID=UPI0020CDB3A5|nr:VapE domain-containing protein [Synechococcus sp. L2F]MCP9829279.1 bifunctional DNA primase/polymerase [Synechococcus sp. L2F]